jgi:hypothetical protein
VSLQAAGRQVQRVEKFGVLGGVSDQTLMKYAYQRGMVIITHDRDFIHNVRELALPVVGVIRLCLGTFKSIPRLTLDLQVKPPFLLQAAPIDHTMSAFDVTMFDVDMGRKKQKREQFYRKWNATAEQWTSNL